MAKPISVYLEVGHNKTFACALDWPGWCRSAKDEHGALGALAEYETRYAAVAAEAGVRFGQYPDFDVTERVSGSASTDFGVPGAIPESDSRPTTAAAARRQATIVEASWTVLAGVAAAAPAELRKGPRGGGRDRDKMLQHVLAAEAAYARKIGIRRREPALGDTDAIAALRGDMLAVLEAARSGAPVVDRGWPPRYAARRIAWHALDHAWEMEDRSDR